MTGEVHNDDDNDDNDDEDYLEGAPEEPFARLVHLVNAKLEKTYYERPLSYQGQLSLGDALDELEWRYPYVSHDKPYKVRSIYSPSNDENRRQNSVIEIEIPRGEIPIDIFDDEWMLVRRSSSLWSRWTNRVKRITKK